MLESGLSTVRKSVFLVLYVQLPDDGLWLFCNKFGQA